MSARALIAPAAAALCLTARCPAAAPAGEVTLFTSDFYPQLKQWTVSAERRSQGRLSYEGGIRDGGAAEGGGLKFLPAQVDDAWLGPTVSRPVRLAGD